MRLQVEEQFSAESLQLLPVPQVQQATGSRLAHNPGISMRMPTTTHLPTPAGMHDAVTTYLSSPDQALMQPAQKISSLLSNPMPSSLVKSNSLMGSATSLSTVNATLLPKPHAGYSEYSNEVAAARGASADSQTPTEIPAAGMPQSPSCAQPCPYRFLF